MDKPENTIIAAAAVATAAMLTVKTIKSRRRQRAVELEIKQKTLRDIESIKRAHDRVLEKIHNGEYSSQPHVGIVAIMHDFEFYQIVDQLTD